MKLPSILSRLSFIFLTPLVSAAQNVIDTSSRPAIFAEGVISTPYPEWSTSFTPDGKTVYSSQGGVYWTIVYSKKTEEKWGKPKVASFSGAWNDTDPFISPDGKRMFFISNRPLPGGAPDKYSPTYHLWYVDHLSGDDWSVPHHLEAPVNLAGSSCYAPSVSRNGTLYFCARDREGNKGMASYAAVWLGSGYGQPKLVTIDSVSEIQDPFISPDENYLLFVSGSDIYISYRENNRWAAAQKLGPQVNNGDGNSSPYVSADGKMLYYSSGRIQGFYKRNKEHALDYDGLVKEMQSLYNSGSNILMIPIHLPGSASRQNG